MGVLSGLKKRLADLDRDAEAEHIYKRERELARGQGERRRKLKAAYHGKKNEGFLAKVGKFGNALNANFEKIDEVMLGPAPKKRKRKR